MEGSSYNEFEDNIEKVANLILNSGNTVAFTGAGISVESGIPTFRGKNGLWKKYNPELFRLDYFKRNPEKSWKLCKKLFFEEYKNVFPNKAHKVLARIEKNKLLEAILTQNIDNLHQDAGSQNVIELHGNTRNLSCTGCGQKVSLNKINLEKLPPKCSDCGSIYKPDFVFFGEDLPPNALSQSYEYAQSSEVMLIIGTTGKVQPVASLPYKGKNNNSKIIEINIHKSNYTDNITDIFINKKAGIAMTELENIIFN